MQKIYDKIGRGYDTTRRADPYLLGRFNSLLNIEMGKNYLDVACGTGNYTSELSKYGGNWSAFDQSEVMLSEAVNKSQLVKWSKCDVEQTGFKSDYFDVAICSLAIHHFPNLPNAFKEISRILKPQGKIVLFTATPQQMYSYWLTEYFPDMMKKSCQQMPSIDTICKAVEPHNLRIDMTIPFFIEPDLQDFFLYSGKQRPEMYLTQKVRDGISSFRNFCSQKELVQGLSKLQSDIESGLINDVIKNYDNELGDYLFLVLSKS
jgi:ubiquinone/menaquinone biosynthesis C-methylase UbiE